MTGVVVRDEAVGFRSRMVSGTAALAIGRIAIRKAAGEIPRPVRMQVDRAADTAIGGAGCRGFDHVHAVEQGRRQHGEVRLLRIDLVGRDEYFAVQHGADLRQSAYVHRGAHACIAIDLHTGHALQRVGDRGVGQGADVLCRDAVLDIGSIAFEIDRADLRGTHTRHIDGRQVDRVLLRVSSVGFLGVSGGRCRLRRRGLRSLAVLLNVGEGRRCR